MSEQLNRNKVSISLSPNNYYTQLPKSGRDAGALGQVEISPMQIKKLEIFKSYLYHVTDVMVEIDNIDPNVATLWGEGKYVAQLFVNPVLSGDTLVSINNYFVCSDMKVKPTPIEHRVYTAIETISVVIFLKSITRTRLEAENNFTFELGGKNGKGAAGIGQAPIQFLHSELMELYTRNYMEEGDDATIPWNTEYCDLIEPIHQIHTTPSNGYKMITDNNMDTLSFFFKHYPVFNTTYDWLLDDCSTGGLVTELRISDFVWWPAWEPFIRENLSNILNRKTAEGKIPSSPEFRTAAAIKYYGMQQIEHVSYHDWVVYYVKNGYPKIWAEDVSSGKPIPMNSWNAIHQKAPVLTPNGNIKLIENPMYQEYLTFMTTREIEETQLFKNVYQNLHPTLEKYVFFNIFVGDVDIHTIVEFKKDDVADTEKFDRLGMGYQVLHTYTREDLQPKGLSKATSTDNDSDPDNSQYSYSHALTTEIVFLTIDKGELNITEVGNEDAINVSADPSAYDINPTDQCAGATDFYGGTEGTGTGTDGRGIPGNKSIADQGEALYNAGFRYIYGGTSDKFMDCSAFTQKAVTRSGIAGYPRTTAGQRPWLQKRAQLISPGNGKRGDILMFRWRGNRSFGHTGIAINSTDYIHSSGGSRNTASNPGKGASKGVYSTKAPGVVEIYRLKEG